MHSTSSRTMTTKPQLEFSSLESLNVLVDDWHHIVVTVKHGISVNHIQKIAKAACPIPFPPIVSSIFSLFERLIRKSDNLEEELNHLIIIS